MIWTEPQRPSKPLKFSFWDKELSLFDTSDGEWPTPYELFQWYEISNNRCRERRYMKLFT